MKRAAQISLWISLLFALASNSFAILRPPFPHRTMPPRGHFVIEEDSMKATVAKKSPGEAKKFYRRSCD
ncbi:MAG: hypothetical protein ABJB69_04130 [Spartobacteria bacterium]